MGERNERSKKKMGKRFENNITNYIRKLKTHISHSHFKSDLTVYLMDTPKGAERESKKAHTEHFYWRLKSFIHNSERMLGVIRSEDGVKSQKMSEISIISRIDRQLSPWTRQLHFRSACFCCQNRNYEFLLHVLTKCIRWKRSSGHTDTGA